MFLFTTLIKLYRRTNRHVCMPLKCNHIFIEYIFLSLTTAKNKKIYFSAERKPLLPPLPLFTHLLCVYIHLFRNVHAIIMGGLSCSSYIVELFSVFYFLHASALCQISTTSKGNQITALLWFFRTSIKTLSLSSSLIFPNFSQRTRAHVPQRLLFKFCTFSTVSFLKSLTVSNLPLPGIQHLISSGEKK